jgi:hypothetical protein
MLVRSGIPPVQACIDDARRPTRDIDFAARNLANDATLMLGVTRQIAAISLDDGLSFNAEEATGESIREDDNYSGVPIR